ncbi:hypothetical protein QTG54_008998 [Skeletonema marinoi]|uniref:Uncharacterized protein n=1 Tax=Skeletonema marinoi TaxID=267567 RepID=A0AAD8Y5K5_9STRA|nr:hypothetical protein QTG54_008998 [Skeletonema marinoi]
MAAMNEDTPLLSVGTRSSSLRRSPVEATTGRSHICSTNTLKMICILFIAIGAAGLLFIGGDNQQGHFLKASIRQSSAVTDTIRLEPAAHLSSQHSKTKGVELSTPATEQAVGSVGSNDEEETQLDSAVAEIETTAKASPIQRSVRFIPYPHKTLGSGSSLQCEWETRPITNASTSSELLDFTQRNAFIEGVCIPPTLHDTLHIFSSAEAIQCLSSEAQNRDIRVILSGDSYMRQLYIGLTDILLSKHISDDKEIIENVQRSKMLSTARYWMNKRHENNATFPFVQFRCGDECYGSKTLDVCSKCINSLSENSDVWVVGVGIHIYERVKNHVNGTLQEIQQFLDREEGQNRTIYVSPPAGPMENVYRGLLPNVAPENPEHPFLDVYESTESCTMENCTFDGSHRSRYVNRWKAQLLLNTLCEVQ